MSQRKSKWMVKLLTISVTLNECKYELLEHPPYSPDFAPSSEIWRNFVLGKCFLLDEEAISFVKRYVVESTENHNRDEIKLLQLYCIEIKDLFSIKKLILFKSLRPIIFAYSYSYNYRYVSLWVRYSRKFISYKFHSVKRRK